MKHSLTIIILSSLFIVVTVLIAGLIDESKPSSNKPEWPFKVKYDCVEIKSRVQDCIDRAEKRGIIRENAENGCEAFYYRNDTAVNFEDYE